ncbi:hypothetical protein CBL_05096 [Carabus blaptoides fortunei]
MRRRPRALIIVDPPMPVPSNPTSSYTGTDDPPPTTGTVPATRSPACRSPMLLPRSLLALVRPAPQYLHVLLDLWPRPLAPCMLPHIPTQPLACLPPWTGLSWTGQGTTGRKPALWSRTSRLHRYPPAPTASTPDKSGQIVSITGLPAKFNTAKALATEAEQLEIAVQDIRISRTSSTLRLADPKLLSKLSALSHVVNARLTLKIVNTPSQSPDLQHRRLPSYSYVDGSQCGVGIDGDGKRADKGVRGQRIENPSFINLFKNFDVKVMCRKTAVNKLFAMYTDLINNIKYATKDIKYFCTTADIWSAKRRSFFGVTLHWIDNKDLKRYSCAIACKRFFGIHSYGKVAEMLENINLKFNLNSTNIVAAITDNGSNFVKAFKEYGINIENASEFNHSNEEEDSDAESNIDFEKIPYYESEAEEENVKIKLPKHLRCASHTLNLIATTDVAKSINSNASLRPRHNSAFSKCSALWKKASKPKSAEMIEEVLGHTLSYPVVTRWNSTYESINQIISEKSKLATLFSKLNLNSLKETEYLYLEEYCIIMKPLTETLDKLQGEKSCFFAYLFPCLISLKNKWEKMKTNLLLKQGQIILETCLTSLNRRFLNVLNLSETDAIIASVVHPKFKTKWFKENPNNNITLKNIQEMVLRAIQSTADSYVSSDDAERLVLW